MEFKINQIQQAVESQTLGDFDKAEGAYDQLYGPKPAAPSTAPRINKRRVMETLGSPTNPYLLFGQQLTEAQSALQSYLPREPRDTTSTAASYSQGFLVGPGRVPDLINVPDFCYKNAKIGKICSRRNCPNAHLSWDDFTPAQKTEIGTKVSAERNISLAPGCTFVPPPPPPNPRPPVAPVAPGGQIGPQAPSVPAPVPAPAPANPYNSTGGWGVRTGPRPRPR